MDKNCGNFLLKKLYFVNYLDFTVFKCLDHGWIGRCFKNSELDLDREISVCSTLFGVFPILHECFPNFLLKSKQNQARLKVFFM